MSKWKRYTISFPPDIEKLITDDSELNGRTISNVVVWNLTMFYTEQKRQATLFKPQPLEEERRQPAYFSTPEVPVLETQRKKRLISGPNKTA